MTRPSQTATELYFARRFFCGFFGAEDSGLQFESPAPPAPDILVRGVRLLELEGLEVTARTDGVAVEVTEYHPAAWGCKDFRRTEVDWRWENELLPTIDAVRLSNPAMESIAAQLDFKDVRLPKNRQHAAIARELVRAVEAVKPRIPRDCRIKLSFLDKDTVSRMPQALQGWTFLASEDFPLAAEHFNVICLESIPGWPWPPWSSPRMLGGWVAPSASEFAQILEIKAGKARNYDTQCRPLWLLIVADLANDRESHIVPQEEFYLQSLQDQVSATEFDFARGPFQQVWLFSEFTEGKVRLYPAGPLILRRR